LHNENRRWRQTITFLLNGVYMVRGENKRTNWSTLTGSQRGSILVSVGGLQENHEKLLSGEGRDGRWAN